MKIRRGNNNGNPTMIVSIPPVMRKQLGLSLGDEVMWNQNEKGNWELKKLVIQ